MRRGDAVKYGIGVAVLLAAGILALSLSRVTGSSVNPDIPIGSKFSLRLLGPLTVGQAGEIVAARAGLFDRAGISVQLKPAGDVDPLKSVVDGTDTFGVADAGAFLVARAKGAPIIAFAGIHLESEAVFFSRELERIYSPREFIGKRVVRIAGTPNALIYDAMLRQANITRSQIREVASGGIEDLADRKIDVLPGRITADSWRLKQKGVAFSTIRPGDYGVHVPGLVYFTTEKIINENPSIMQRFLKGLIAGWGMVYADGEKSIPLIAAASQGALDADEIRYKLAAQRDFVLPVDRRVLEFDELQWRQLIALLRNAKLIDDEMNMARAVNYDLLREAYRTSVTSSTIRGN